MSTLDHAATLQEATRPAWAVRFVNAVRDVVRAWRNRRAFYRLGELSDTELADIGLRRADLHVAVGLPLSQDPTTHLGVLASDRIRRMEDLARRVS